MNRMELRVMEPGEFMFHAYRKEEYIGIRYGKIIPDYNSYCCDRDGNIYSNKRGTWRLLALYHNDNGYLCVSISTNPGNKKLTVHRAVALAWIPNPENKPCVDHINRNPLDNRVVNLRWVTVIENNRNRRNSLYIVNKRRVLPKDREEYEELLEKLQRELDEFYISKGLL